jgi:hypothetical protein
MADESVIATEIGPKTFQCNFTQPPIPGAIELLNAAAGALSLMLDKATGQPSFKIQQRLQRMPSEPDGYYAIATGVYPVAGTTGSVRLGLNAIGEGRVGTRLVVVFQDSMGWALPSAEEFVDVGMQTIAYGLASIPNDGWRMIEGRWRHAHRFDALGVTDEGQPAQAPASVETGDLPEGLLNSPTDRAFRNHLPGMSAEETRQILATALRDAWALESSNFGVELILLARNRAWPRQVLGIAASCAPIDDGAVLTIRFGDVGRWASEEARDALVEAMTAVTVALRTRFAGFKLEPWAIPGT